MLGINAAHDGSACVSIDGRLRFAIAEERFSRRKHQSGPPRRAIRRCLEEAGLGSLDAVDCIVLNEYPRATDFGAELRGEGYEGELFVNPSHHLLHACYAAAASGLADAAILIADGSGYSYVEHSLRGSPLLGPPPASADMEEAESTFALRAGELQLVERRWGSWDAHTPYLRFPSLGHMFSVASQYIFGDWTHAGKTMGLAPYGDSSKLPAPIVAYGEDGYTIDTEWVLRLPPRSDAPAHLDETCRDVAAKVQDELERALLFLVRRLHAATELPLLCLSGGVALNSVANGRLRREGPFEEVFVTPAAGDSGVALGATAFGHRRLTGELPDWRPYSDFLGPTYGPQRSSAALEAASAAVGAVERSDTAADAAGEIAAGRVVGWFEGRSELGPRALGHRSILCDPRGGEVRAHLNEWVKFREPFRPYAASVLEEHAAEYFELQWVDRFMLSVVQIHQQHRELLPSICHVDGSCRIQTVPAGAGAYRRLIEAFHELTGLPIVLNTSLNIRGEPIVETPEDAIACFAATNIDLLYLDGRRLEKQLLDVDAVDARLVPHATAGVRLDSERRWNGGGWSSERTTVLTRTRYRAALSPLEAGVMRRLDGRATVGELIAGETGEQTLEALAGLQRRGLIWMANGRGPR